MTVNDYYSLRVLADGPYTESDEPLHLCDDCADRYADQITPATDGEPGDACEFCDATNEEA